MNDIVQPIKNNFNETLGRDIERRQKLGILSSLKEIHTELKRLADKIDSLESNAKPAKPSRAKKTEE